VFSSTLFHPWFHPRGHLQSYDRWFRPRRDLLPLPINPPVQFQTLCTHFNCVGLGASVRHHLPRHPWGWTTPESAHLSRPRPSPTPQKNRTFCHNKMVRRRTRPHKSVQRVWNEIVALFPVRLTTDQCQGFRVTEIPFTVHQFICVEWRKQRKVDVRGKTDGVA
jgi:hypothetical protein